MTDQSVTSSKDSIGVKTWDTLDALDTRSFQELNESYKLPIDSDEHSRLDIQHEAVRLMLGGKNYQQSELVQVALSVTESHKRHILDVGAGSGKWYRSSWCNSIFAFLCPLYIH